MDNDKFMSRVAIQSKVIQDPYVKIFVLYSENTEDGIFSFDPSLKPKKDLRGLGSDVTFSSEFIDGVNRDSIRRHYLKTFNLMYSITIDSVDYDPEFLLSQNRKNELGFETYVGTGNLDEGKHILKVNRLRIRKGDTTKRRVETIPFWYFKD